METAPAKVPFSFVRPRVGSAGPCPADRFRDRGGASLFFSREKKSNQKKRAAGREPSLRAGALRFSANQGTAPNSLRSDIGASSPLIPLRCSARSRRAGRSRSTARASTHGVDLLGAAVAFDLESALSEPSTAGPARAKRCGCLSAASSRTVPRRTEERRAPACAARRLAPRRRVSLVTFFARAKRVTPLRGRGNDPPGMARRYRRVGAQTKTPGARPGVPALLYKRRLTPPSTPAARRCALPAAGGS